MYIYDQKAIPIVQYDVLNNYEFHQLMFLLIVYTILYISNIIIYTPKLTHFIFSSTVTVIQLSVIKL